MRARRRFMFACGALLTFIMASVTEAQPALSLTYDAVTGTLSYSADEELRFMQLVSQSGQITEEAIQGAIYQTDQMLQFLPSDHPAEFVFDGLLPRGLADAELTTDLCIEAVDVTGAYFGTITLNGAAWITSPISCEKLREPRKPVTDPRAVLYYDATNGNIRVDVSQAPDSEGQAKITTLQMTSAAEIFTGEPAQGLVSPFAVDRDDKIFHHSESGFADVDFGNVARTGLSNHEFVADVCVIGSWYGGGALLVEYQYPGAGTVPLICPKNAETTNLAVMFDANAGTLAIDARGQADDPVAGDAKAISTLEVRSRSGLFTGTLAANLNGPDDRFEEGRILKQDPEGFGHLDLGPIVKQGITLEMLRDDLVFDVTTLDGSRLGQVVTVPEPTGTLVPFVTIVGLISQGRSRRPLSAAC